MRGSIQKAEELAKSIPDSFMAKQFENPANPRIHELTTAKEILKDANGKVDIFVAGVGTGGTLVGVGRELKKRNPSTLIAGVEPATSAVLSGSPAGTHAIQGIGAGFVPSVVDKTVIDTVITVTDQETYEWTRKIVQKEGVSAGISSGAALCAADKLISSKNLKGKTIVVLFPDTMERYLTVPGLFSET